MTDARIDRLADVEGPEFDELDDEVMPNPVDMVVFDIGNVLIRWQPRDALVRGVSEQEADAFLADEALDFHRHNVSADGGRLWEEIIADVESRHPHHGPAARAYVEHFAHSIAEPISGTVEILKELHAAQVPLFGLTNFSAELFPLARRDHDFLELFEDIVVSGEEGVCKPDPEIWEILEEATRHVGGLTDAIFIDDTAANVLSAEEAGLDAICFTDPESLREELRLRGLPLRAAGRGN